MNETARELRERVEKARDLLDAGNRTRAKFLAVGALVRLGYHPDDARKFSAERAIDRAHSRLEKRERTIHFGDHYDDVCGPYCPAINTDEEWTAEWRKRVGRRG